MFQDRIDNCRNNLKEQKNVEIADENCFVGFDAFETTSVSDADDSRFVGSNQHPSFSIVPF